MNRRARTLGIILVGILILAACGKDEDVATQDLPPSASKSAVDLKVTDQREIEIEEGQLISLSPNGEWLLVEKSRTLCIYAVEELGVKSCIEPQSGSPDLRNSAWSPDGSRVAFTEDFTRLLHESDLWVLEAESGKLSNLTDDGVERIRLGSQEGKFQADISPAWSPDGKTLLFSRSAQSDGKWEGTALYRVAAGGGNLKKLLAVSDETPAVVWSGLRWSGDGKKILYTVNDNKLDSPDNGIWIADQDGKNPKHILGTTDSDLGPPRLMDVTGLGDKALVWYYVAAGKYTTDPNVSHFALLDLKTGALIPLKQAKSDEPEFFSPTAAVFAPGGSKVLYSYRTVDGESRLVVRDVDGGKENILLSDERALGISLNPGIGLSWANNDTIYVSVSGQSRYLLSVGGE